MRVNWCTRRERADHGVVVHMNVAGELRAVFEHDAVADDAIVRDVRVGHDEIVAADARDVAAFVRAAVGGGEFAEFVGVARFEPGALAVIGEILRVAADGRKRNRNDCCGRISRGRAPRRGFRRCSRRRVPLHRRQRRKRRREHFVPTSREGETMARGSISLIGAFSTVSPTGACSGSRSTILHISVASAASSPFTEARPSSLQKPPRQASTFISIRN